jgi:hypothetical protein
MKRHLLIGLGLAAALLVHAALPAVPDLGNPRIVVLANNLQNYYIHYNTGRGDYTEAQMEAKTNKIVEAMLKSGADLLAFCEVEAKPDVLEHLAAEMNTKAGTTGVYVALSDGIDVTWDEEYDNNIKVGFIYRSDKVQPYMGNYYAKNVTYYKNVLRIQAWTEISSGERFTLSMNHFKAMSDEASKNKRVDNATWVMNALGNYAKDPDILLMGDLNAQMDEACISVILNKDYAEQLLRFDEQAYSYVYYGDNELIDHAFANSTMASQITGAAVWHTNTSTYYNNRYSDHDAVVVGLRLGNEPVTDIDHTTSPSGKTYKKIRQGQIIIIRGGVEYTIIGQRLY